MAGAYRLVASDIDGTLIIDWDPRGINPKVFDQIRELRRRGAIFLASSGRQYPNLRRLFAPVADEIAYLCENGAVAFWQGEPVVCRPMEPGLALDICHRIQETEGLHLLISGLRTSYVLASEPEFVDHMRTVVGNVVIPVARPEDVPERMIKVSYHSTPEVMERERAGFEAAFGDVCKVVTSGATWMDVVGKGIDKGSTMRELGELWGIGPAQMMAFGDNLNDAEMLDLVGAPYLMESGNPELSALNSRMRRCRSVHEALEGLLATPGVF